MTYIWWKEVHVSALKVPCERITSQSILAYDIRYRSRYTDAN